MEPDTGTKVLYPSFASPLPLPVQDPDGEPSISITFACSWLPYVRGCLYQLTQQWSWPQDDAALLNQAQAQAMTLISLFTECSGDNIPFACDSDFLGGSEDGWVPIVADGVTYAVWDGSGWEPGCIGCGGADYSQLQIHKVPTETTHWLSATIKYSSTFVDLSLYATYDDVHLIGPVSCPAGDDMIASIAVDQDATDIRLIINTVPPDTTTFKITAVDITVSNASGTCP